MSRLEIESSFREYFPDDAPVRKAFRFNDEHFTGSAPLSLRLTGEPGIFQDPEVLEWLDRLAEYMSGFPKISRVYTIAEYVREMNRVLHEENPAYDRIPDTRQEVAQLLFLTETDGLLFVDCQIESLTGQASTGQSTEHTVESANGVTLSARVGGASAPVTKAHIKAATFHGLEIVHNERGWSTQITFDV